MGEFEVWVYRGAIVLLLGILWYLAKGVLKELRMIRTSLQVQEVVQAKQDVKVNAHETRLTDHGQRIRSLEHKSDSCQYCKEA